MLRTRIPLHKPSTNLRHLSGTVVLNTVFGGRSLGTDAPQLSTERSGLAETGASISVLTGQPGSAGLPKEWIAPRQGTMHTKLARRAGLCAESLILGRARMRVVGNRRAGRGDLRGMGGEKTSWLPCVERSCGWISSPLTARPLVSSTCRARSPGRRTRGNGLSRGSAAFREVGRNVVALGSHTWVVGVGRSARRFRILTSCPARAGEYGVAELPPLRKPV